MLPAALQTMSQLLNLTAHVKVWCEDEQSRPPSLLLKTAVNCLAEHIDTLQDGSDDQHKFSFMLEQLKLTSKNTACALLFTFLVNMNSGTGNYTAVAVRL